jgi:hypothetical protein
MDTHFHVLCQTLSGFPLDKTLHSWKSFPAHEINKLRSRTGSVFQKSNHTRLLSTQRQIDDVRQYIYNNPFERWKIEPHKYEWLEVFK